MMGLLFLAGMAALYIAAQSSARAASNDSFDRLLVGSALSIAETLSVSNGRVLVDLPYAALDMLSASKDDRVFYRVLGPAGEIVTGDAALPVPPGIARDARLDGATEPRFFDARYSGELVRFAVIGRQLAQPGATGWLWVQVGQTRRARDALMNDMVLGAVAPIAGMTVLALAVVWFGIGGALMPLARIGRELEARGSGDLGPITAPVPVEVAPMVDSLNQFMKRLDDNIDTLRAFIAEAAHQMRTPLAAMLAQAQVAAAGSDEDRRRGLHAIERNGVRLSRLLNQLLSDATVMHRSDVRVFEDFDLLRVVRLAVRESVPMASGLEVRVDSELSAAPFRGDGLMMGEAIKNVIDNAFRHGQAASRGLTVAFSADAGAYVIQITDHGDGIPAERRERVFERFARETTGVPGAGLGMAIMARAVSSHGGEVTLSDGDGGGLVVTIRVPRLPEPETAGALS